MKTGLTSETVSAAFAFGGLHLLYGSLLSPMRLLLIMSLFLVRIAFRSSPLLRLSWSWRGGAAPRTPGILKTFITFSLSWFWILLFKTFIDPPFPHTFCFFSHAVFLLSHTLYARQCKRPWQRHSIVCFLGFLPARLPQLFPPARLPGPHPLDPSSIWLG